MKILRIAIIAMSFSALTWSCQTGPSETDNAYAEMTEQTDSIQTMNSHLMDTLEMVRNDNDKMMTPMDTSNQDSTRMETLARNQVILDEKKASLDKINQQVSDFESFEADHDKGDMAEKDVKAKVDEIKKQQNDIFSAQKEIKRELNRMHRDHKNMMDREQNDAMNEDGMKDTKTGMEQTKTGKK